MTKHTNEKSELSHWFINQFLTNVKTFLIRPLGMTWLSSRLQTCKEVNQEDKAGHRTELNCPGSSSDCSHTDSPRGALCRRLPSTTRFQISIAVWRHCSCSSLAHTVSVICTNLHAPFLDARLVPRLASGHEEPLFDSNPGPALLQTDPCTSRQALVPNVSSQLFKGGDRKAALYSPVGKVRHGVWEEGPVSHSIDVLHQVKEQVPTWPSKSKQTVLKHGTQTFQPAA